jgi:hypothetical protein
MGRLTKGGILFFLGLVFWMGNTQTSLAQNGANVVTSDFESWISAGLKLKVHDKWTFELSEQLRLEKNSTQINQYFTNLAIGYEPFKFIEIGAAFRFYQQNEEADGYSSHYRINLDVAFKHKLERFSFNYRLRYQFKNELGVTSADGDYFKHGFRLRAKAAYNIKKIPLEPSLAVEMFNEYEKYTLPIFNKLRFTAALAYDFKKYGKLKLFYSLEQEVFTSYPKSTSIVGLGYVYTIKIKNKTKK